MLSTYGPDDSGLIYPSPVEGIEYEMLYANDNDEAEMISSRRAKS